MGERINIGSGIKWEAAAGYSRAVRVGNIVEVAGTTAVDENGEIVGPRNPYQQARFIITKIEKALMSAGASLSDVVRTRMFVTNISNWEEVSKAHREYFGDIRPAATLVQVSALIHPDLVIEIEATAILSGA